MERAVFVRVLLSIILAVIEGKDVLVALIEAVRSLFLGNSLPCVLNEPYAFFDFLGDE
jgi:hypothetical protein